jgi:tellurite resistance protein TerB
MGFFGKLTRSSGKAINKNAFEAAIAAGVLVAASDGEIGKKETDKVEKLVLANDSFKAFKKPEVQKQVQTFSSVIEADFRLGRKKLLKEIEDIADNSDDGEEVFLLAISVAEASDDGIGKAEYKTLVEIGGILGFHPKDYDVVEPA